MSDFQFIEGPNGVMSDLGQADGFVVTSPGTDARAVHAVKAYVDGFLTANGSFTVYADASPS